MTILNELLLLKQISGIGKVKINDTFVHILNECDSLAALVEKLHKMNYAVNEETLNKVEEKYNYIISHPEIKAITMLDKDYPKALDVMGHNRPNILYAMGNIDLLNEAKRLAVIGTRKPSALSIEEEGSIVRNVIGKCNPVIVSGLALGCDEIAHEATLEAGGKTIAVLPSGFNKIAPKPHTDLARRIVENGGCIISEYEPFEEAKKYTYTERDAIIAAISNTLFIMESSLDSGTMITAKAGNKYGKKICAYKPKNSEIHTFDGNRKLIGEGAASIVNASDLERALLTGNSVEFGQQLSIFDL